MAPRGAAAGQQRAGESGEQRQRGAAAAWMQRRGHLPEQGHGQRHGQGHGAREDGEDGGARES